MKKNLKSLVFSDYHGCFEIDSLEGLPPYLPGDLEEEVARFGARAWKEITELNLLQWIDRKVQSLYDEYGLDNRITYKIKKNRFDNYITATITWTIPQGQSAPKKPTN